MSTEETGKRYNLRQHTSKKCLSDEAFDKLLEMREKEEIEKKEKARAKRLKVLQEKDSVNDMSGVYLDQQEGSPMDENSDSSTSSDDEYVLLVSAVWISFQTLNSEYTR